jgi:hypothetical protein
MRRKKMKRTLILVVLAAAVAVPPSFGDMIYNVSFEDPPHTVDSAVATAVGMSDRPEGTIGSVITRTGIADFSTQVGSLEPAGIMRFLTDTPVSSGLVVLSWDLAMISFGPGGDANTAWAYFLSDGGNNGAVNMYWQRDSSFDLGGSDAAAFTLGQQDHYEFLLDLDNDRYDFAFNGVAVLTNQSLNAGFDVQSVVFAAQNLQSPTYAVDNFRWEVVPEPSTWLLISTGCLAAVYGRRLFEAKAAGR